MNPITNQYVQNTYTGHIILPDVLASNVNTIATGSHSAMIKYRGINVPVTGYNPSGSGIILASNPSGMTQFAPQEGVSMRAYTGDTFITTLTSSGLTRVWNG